MRDLATIIRQNDEAVRAAREAAKQKARLEQEANDKRKSS